MSLSRIAWLFLFFAGACAAQSLEVETSPGISEQRRVLNVEREQVLRDFDALDAQCKNQFAVSGCLKDVNRQRLFRLSEIKKAQGRLQDSERMQRGVEQLQQLEQKAKERERQTSASFSAQSLGEQLPPTLKTGLDSQTPAKLDSVHSPEYRVSEPARNLPPKVGPDAAQQRENRNAYLAKQSEADKKRLDREKRVREQKTKNKGLPAAP